jgi:hypothetical protein
MAKAVEKWEARDGRVFDSQEEAIEHERWLDFEELCRSVGIYSADAEDLYRRRGELLKILGVK